MRSNRLASGGDSHLDPDYIKKSIAETQDSIRCYFYQVEDPNGVYAGTFVPEMKRLGYVEEPPSGKLHVFCRDE